MRGCVVGGGVVVVGPGSRGTLRLSVGVVGVSVVGVSVVVVSVVMVVGGSAGPWVESLGLLGRHVDGGLLNRMGLHCHQLIGPFAAGPADRLRQNMHNAGLTFQNTGESPIMLYVTATDKSVLRDLRVILSPTKQCRLHLNWREKIGSYNSLNCYPVKQSSEILPFKILSHTGTEHLKS